MWDAEDHESGVPGSGHDLVITRKSESSLRGHLDAKQSQGFGERPQAITMPSHLRPRVSAVLVEMLVVRPAPWEMAGKGAARGAPTNWGPDQ